MKKVYLIALSALAFGSASAQTVFSSNFEDWTAGTPDDFFGAKTSLEADSIEQITSGAVYGSNTAKLYNEESSHKRLSTQPVPVVMDTTYEVTFWVKGQGDIRVGIFDGDMDGNDYGYDYANYISVNTSTWEQHTQSIVADTTNNSTAEFLISVRNMVDGSELELDSVVVNVGTYVPPASISIYDIQYSTANPADSPYSGQIVSTGGIVTGVRADGRFYLQSGNGPWSGVYVYDSQNTVNIGDSVTLDAEVDEYFDLTELKNVTNFNLVSSGNFFMSNPVSSADAMTEQYEGCLVTVTNAVCSNADVGANFGEWTINDGSGPAQVDDFLYAYTPILNNAYNVTGLVDYNYGEFKILPRDANDVSTVSGVNEMTELEASIYPNPTNGTILVDAPLNSEVVVYSSEGKICYTTSNTQLNQVIDLSALENGNYIVRITNANSTTTKSLIKQ